MQETEEHVRAPARTFQDLLVWQKAMTLVTNVYHISSRRFQTMKNIHRYLLTITSMAILTMGTAPVRADFDSADSADFSVNLLDIPSGGTAVSADSGDFSMDLRLVNRGWADSGDVVIGDTPPPAPEIVDMSVLGSVKLDEPFVLQVTLRNNGGDGDHGGLSISFPDLVDVDSDDSMPPYESAVAEIDLHPETTFSVVSWVDAGDDIYEDGNPTPIPAEHLLVEGDKDGWSYDETHTLKLMITPRQPGSLAIRVRGWIAADGTTYGPPTYRAPSSECLDCEQDQQGYWADVLCVEVEMEIQPASVTGPNSIRAEALHELGITGHGVKIGIAEADDENGGNLPWTGHASLAALQNGESDYSSASNHATQVSSIMVGFDDYATPPPLGTTLPDLYTYAGVANGSVLYADQTNVWWTIDDAVADLRNQGCSAVNVSGGIDPDNVSVPDVNTGIDTIVDQDRVVVVAATGNASMPSDDEIASPAEAYNTIAVGALGASDNEGSEQSGPWTKTSDENIPGPTSGSFYTANRCKPDIVAPGDCVVATSSGDDAHGYSRGGPGSSLATPHVTGTVALLMQSARQAEANGDNLSFVDNYGTVEPRAIKSALLTGANKSITVPQDGDRGWTTSGSTQPLDYALGAGGLDALEAYKVMLGETSTDYQGNVIHRGTEYDTIAWQEQGDAVVSWNIGAVDEPSMLTATLVWNAHYTALGGIELNNLDLGVMRDSSEIGKSDSAIDNVEHVHMLLNDPGTYTLEIRYVSQETDDVDPEPFAISYRLEPVDYTAYAPVDFNEDGYVDDTDFSHFQDCATGPNIPQDVPDCQNAKLDGDNDVDQSDFAVFQRCYSGSDHEADPGCAQ